MRSERSIWGLQNNRFPFLACWCIGTVAILQPVSRGSVDKSLAAMLDEQNVMSLIRTSTFWKGAQVRMLNVYWPLAQYTTQTNEANKKSFVTCHPTWPPWRQLQTKNCSQNFIVALEALLLGQLFIFETISPPRPLSSNIPAAWSVYLLNNLRETPLLVRFHKTRFHKSDSRNQ